MSADSPSQQSHENPEDTTTAPPHRPHRLARLGKRTAPSRTRMTSLLRGLRGALTPERTDPEKRFEATLFPTPNPDQAPVSEAEKKLNAPKHEFTEALDSSTVVRDHNPETLIDKRRSNDDGAPYGELGEPFSRQSTFIIGFTGALGVIVALALAFSIYRIQSVLLMIAVSLFLAIGLNPLVERLIRWGVRRSMAVLIVFLGMVIFFAGALYAIVPPVVEQTQILIDNVPDIIQTLQKSETIRNYNEKYKVLDNAQKYFANKDFAAQVTTQIFGWGKFLLGLIFTTITILTMTLYFMASLPVMKRHAYAMVPASRRTRVMLLTDEILLRIGGYVSGACLVSAISGIACYIYLSIIGIDYALPLAIAAALLSLIPMVGATFTGTILSIVGFFYSLPIGIATIIYYVLYQQIENYIIYPKIMKHSIDVPPVITIVAALIGASLMGMVGVLLAIPTAAAALLIIREVVIPRQEHA